MDHIGEFVYPTLRTFQEALDVASQALNKFGGIIPNIEVAKILGYGITNPAAMSGTVYKNFNDLVMYGLLERESVRGAMKTTPLARDALHPHNQAQATLARARALRAIPIIDRAYNAWNGELPEDSAFSAKISELTGADWVECKNKAPNIKNLLSEAFPYLMASAQGEGGISSDSTTDRGEIPSMPISTPVTASPSPQPITTPKLLTVGVAASPIEEFVLGDGIRIYLPRANLKPAWEKAKKALKVLVEEVDDPKTEEPDQAA